MHFEVGRDVVSDPPSRSRSAARRLNRYVTGSLWRRFDDRLAPLGRRGRRVARCPGRRVSPDRRRTSGPARWFSRRDPAGLRRANREKARRGAPRRHGSFDDRARNDRSAAQVHDSFHRDLLGQEGMHRLRASQVKPRGVPVDHRERERKPFPEASRRGALTPASPLRSGGIYSLRWSLLQGNIEAAAGGWRVLIALRHDGESIDHGSCLELRAQAAIC